jgi:predicted DNA-binding protein (UPF0251 family)
MGADMPRPLKSRTVNGYPAATIFKPAGIPKFELEDVVLTLDEFEALRLADFQGLYQDDAAASMNVSRQTFGNILTLAHRKIADVLVNGKALRIEGGPVDMNDRVFECGSCARRWTIPCGGDHMAACPKCGSADLHHPSFDPGRGHGEGCARGRRKIKGGCS